MSRGHATVEILRGGGGLAAVAAAAGGRAPWTRRDGLVVVLRGADGALGVGEASPLPGYGPETLDACAAALAPLAGARLELAAAPSSPADAYALIDDVLAGLTSRRGLTSPAARFALETALLDLEGRRRGRPLAALLGGEVERRVPLAALVTTPADAIAAVAAGLHTLKLKLAGAGVAWADDLSRARAVRDAVGTAVALRFDAGGGFPADTVAARLAALAELAPEFVEEPIGGAALAALRDAPVSLAADESLQDGALVPALARTCDVFVLKPTTLGGLGRCLALARVARAACVSHAFDGPVALAAAAELAAALPGAPRAAGLAPHAGLTAWPAVAVAQLDGVSAGSARRPGLGLDTPRLLAGLA